MQVSGKKTTRSKEAFLSLRDRILSGSIPAGSKLRINELCRQLDVSLGAVREALSQLTAEGLVLSEAHRGFTVAPISNQELIDLTRVFVEVQVLCLTWSIQSGNVEWESNIAAALHRLSKARRIGADGRPTAEWKDAHNRFHYALIAACDSPRLLQIRQHLYELSERYRRLNASIPPSQTPHSDDERLADAVLARNIPASITYCRAHVNMIVDHVLKTIPGRPATTGSAAASRRTTTNKPESKRKRPAKTERKGRPGK